MKMRVALLDSSLELAQTALPNAPKTPDRFELLDASVHNTLGLADRQKRGRPDIVHLALLLLLPEACVEEIVVHTYESKVILFSERRTRIPKNYNRFTRLFGQLLTYERVPVRGRPLITVSGERLSDVLKGRRLVLLDENAEVSSPRRLAELESAGVVFGVGAYAHGGFSEEVNRLTSERLSLGRRPLETSQVILRLLAACCLKPHQTTTEA